MIRRETHMSQRHEGTDVRIDIQDDHEHPHKNMSYYRPDIGTAWLVLSHGAWFGASIASANIGYGFLAIKTTGRALGIGWTTVSILLEMWTIYAIAMTWRASRQLQYTIFGDEAFVTLILLVMCLLATSVWTIVDIGII